MIRYSSQIKYLVVGADSQLLFSTYKPRVGLEVVSFQFVKWMNQSMAF